MYCLWVGGGQNLNMLTGLEIKSKKFNNLLNFLKCGTEKLIADKFMIKRFHSFIKSYMILFYLLLHIIKKGINTYE